MTKEAIYNQLISLIEQEKGTTLSLSLETSVNDEIAEDSVEVMEFILTVEDAFGVEISDEAIDQFTTLSDIVDYIALIKHS